MTTYTCCPHKKYIHMNTYTQSSYFTDLLEDNACADSGYINK
ncbi:MAG: hypothetical protein ACOCWB_02320 [Bacteroidota bacterium]